MENDDRNTALNTTFDMGSDQHHPQMPVRTSPLRCQSTPPRTDTVKMQETPVPAVPTAPHRPLPPRIPLPKSQDSSSNLSQMSAPLFTENRYSSIFDDDLEVYDAEIMLISRQNMTQDHRINLNSHIKTTDVSTAPVITKPVIVLKDYNTRLLPLAAMLEVQVFIKTQINSQTLHLNIVHTHSNTLNKVNLLLV